MSSMLVNPSSQSFVIIAGPCVLEGKRGEVNFDVAMALKQIVAQCTDAGHAIDFYFKSSYDKANRSSIHSYRGPGLEEGLALLQEIKQTVGVRILTDVHTPQEVAPVAEVADMIQIPAFLCRQTDLLIEAGRAQVPVNIKKGQFLAPLDIRHAIQKVKDAGNDAVLVTERGSTFGYNNLVVDMRAIPMMQSLGVPVIFDATHSVQLPGGNGETTGGMRDMAPVLARSAVAAGCNGLFFETHPEPEKGLSDASNMLPLDWVPELLTTCLAIRNALSNRKPDFALNAH